MLRFFAVFALFLGALSILNPLNARPMSEILSSGELKIGVFDDEEPFSDIDNKGNYRGYDVELGKKIAKDLGLKPKFVSVGAGERAQAVQNDSVDIMLANYSITPERSQKVAFSLPYMFVSLGIVSPKDELITGLEQLKGKTLVVVADTTAEDYFAKLRERGDCELLVVANFKEAYDALMNKDVDGMAADNTLLLAWAKGHKDFIVGVESIGKPEYWDSIAVGVNKNNTELLNWINNEIVNLSASEFLKDTYEQIMKEFYR